MDIIMPQLGETVEEGTVAAWYKKAGDSVAVDEPLFEVETDKVTTEVPSLSAGILTEILVEEGETVKVGTRLAVIDTGDKDEAAAAKPAGEKTVKKEPAIAAAGQSKPAPAGSKPGKRQRDFAGPLSPVVRRLLSEHALDPADIEGTGRNGRIQRKDVLRYLETEQGAGAGSRTAAAGQDDEVIPFSRQRKQIAGHMLRSKATSAHVLQAIEVDFNRVEQVRGRHKDSWKQREGSSLTYLPFIARAVCLALPDFPRINASVKEDTLVVHRRIHLGIAVDLGEEGLMVPVIRDAGHMSVAELARAIRRLADKARAGSIAPDDVSGGTYTITNNGTYGTLITAPIINQPQVAILSSDGVKKRPVVIETDSGEAIAVHPVGVLAQSFDHRVIDGAYSGAYMNRLRIIIEQTDWEAELR